MKKLLSLLLSLVLFLSLFEYRGAFSPRMKNRRENKLVEPEGREYRGLLALDSLFLVFVSPALALTPLPQELKEKLATKAGLLKQFLGKHGKIVQGELKAIDGQTLTVSQGGTDYKVTVTANTKFRRRFWGKSELGEFSLNDKVSIFGKWTNEEKTALEAALMRDLSIQKRYGVFLGTIATIDGMTLTVKTVQRGDQKVTLSDKTKIVNRKMQAMKAGDLKIGDKIRVKGLWDRINNTVAEVTQLKDFSQPDKVSPPISPTTQ